MFQLIDNIQIDKDTELKLFCDKGVYRVEVNGDVLQYGMKVKCQNTYDFLNNLKLVLDVNFKYNQKAKETLCD